MVSVTTSTTSSSTTLNGLATGIDTTALINAIVAQKGTGVARLKAQQALNNTKVTTLANMKAELNGLITSMAVLQDKFNSHVVASTDSSNAYVTATAGGGTSGSFDVTVSTVASRGRLSASLDTNGVATNLSVTNPSGASNSSIYTDTPATFALQGTDGKIYQITLDASTNTLNGLRDKINAVAGSSVTASIVNTGKGAKPYQLVVMAKDTGSGSTKGVVSIVDITKQVNPTAVGTTNNLGILTGTLNNLTTPTSLSGGLDSTTAGAVAMDANFTLNGINLTRSSNLVKDVVDGMTFTLKQGGQTGVTTLTVGQDAAGTTAAFQDFITKYNTLVKDYKTASTATKNADGSIAQAPLSGDATTRALMNNLQNMLAGSSAGLPGTSAYKTLTNLGVIRLSDNTLYLNTNAFQQALSANAANVQDLFTFSGASTSPAVSVTGGGAQTATGSVDFAITKDATTGILSGTLTQNGVTSGPILVINGTLSGTGTLAGLTLSVSGTGTGTLTLSRGIGQAAADLLSSFTSTTGGIASLLKTINTQNANLVTQIAQGQTRLDQETASLKDKFAQMEAVVGQMKATTTSLFGT